MSSGEKFDAIIIGAGASGLGAAYMLSKYGFNVLVIERGERVGSKNVYGGRIYSYVFNSLMDNFVKEVPAERWVKRERISLLNDSDALTIEYSVGRDEYNNSFTAYLSSFLKWLSKKVEEQGGLILTGVKADKILFEDNKAYGVLADGDRIFADVIVDAEGINPILAMESGLKDDWKPNNVALGIKEVIKMPKNTIEERLNLDENEGLAQLFIGFPTNYVPGGGFLYTNKDTITLGIVVRLEHTIERRLVMRDIIEEFKQHPYIRRIIKGGTVIEYSAHLVPEISIKDIDLSRLYGNGILIVGDAAGFVLNTGFTIRGVDFAFLSGVLAAEAIKKAHDEGKYTKETLSYYEELLRNSPMINELFMHANAQSFLSTSMLYNEYVKALLEFFNDIYTVNGSSKKLSSVLLRSLSKNKISLVTIIRDLVRGLMNL